MALTRSMYGPEARGQVGWKYSYAPRPISIASARSSCSSDSATACSSKYCSAQLWGSSRSPSKETRLPTLIRRMPTRRRSAPDLDSGLALEHAPGGREPGGEVPGALVKPARQLLDVDEAPFGDLVRVRDGLVGDGRDEQVVELVLDEIL